jgi:hypothetical protein
VQKWYYPTLAFGIILLLIIVVKIVRINKKPVKSEDPLAQFSEQLNWKQRMRRRLREWDKKRQLKKINKQNMAKLENDKKEYIRATAPGIDSISSFIRQKTQEGSSKGEIIKALKSRGWTRKQIKLGFKNTQNDSRKPAQGNQGLS